jgi:hypothetical protein
MKVGLQTIHRSKAASNGICKPKKAPVYRQSYTPADIKKDAIVFYLEKNVSVRQFCHKAKKTAIPFSTFHRHIRLSGLGLLKKQNKPVEQAEAVLNEYISKLKHNTTNRTKTASASHRYLTDNEELAIVQLCRVLANMGQGVSKQEVLLMIDEYLHIEEDDRRRVDCSAKILRGLFERHTDLVKIVAACSIDPQRAKKANTETRDAVFVKLDCYIKSLHAMGLVPWKSFSDVSKKSIYNMDEVGTDTTKHRSKIVADALTMIRKFLITPEGDGRMNMHITACITTRSDGIFRDVRNKIEGAPGPLLIHTDKSKTKGKEAEERERQRKGETPSHPELANRFKENIEGPEVIVSSTHSGSMTQEMFFLFAEHFISSLPENSGPVILLLDGHGSRWSVPALQLLMSHNVYPFFIASHTSIWAQPNDAGVNKRFHWAMEQAARQSRRTAGIATVAYFNEIFVRGWRIFLEAERSELRAMGFNNTTNSYERTGMKPFNPFAAAWTEAIETLGTGVITSEKQKVQYEFFAINEAPTLLPREKALLRNGMDIDETDGLGDTEVALIKGEEILKMWRTRIEHGVSEGNSYEEYARSISPESVATGTEATKIATKLIEFQLVDISKVELPEKSTKKERAAEITLNIVETTQVAEPIKITYLSSSSTGQSTTDDDSRNSEHESSELGEQWVDGSAIKLKGVKRWEVVVNNGERFEVDEEKLLDHEQFFVKSAFDTANKLQKNKEAQKAKRRRCLQQKENEKELLSEANKQRDQRDLNEFNAMKAKIAGAARGDEPEYQYEDFQKMIRRIREPFETAIEGQVITLSESDAAIMMKKSAFEIIKEKVLVRERPNNDSTTSQQNKRRRTGGNATVNTVAGATGHTALHQSARRDKRLNKEAQKKKLTGLKKEKKNIETTLQQVEKRRKKFYDVASVVEGSVAATATTIQNTTQQPTTEETCKHVWEIRENDNQDNMTLFLRLFEPTSGKLSKAKPHQWAFIKSNIIPRLTEASYRAKVEEYGRRLSVIEEELKQYEDENEENVDDCNVDNIS